MEFPSTFDQELYSGTCCVIEEQQSQDGVAIIAYSEYKRSGIQNPILFTGTFDECDQYREKYTPDNPYCSEEYSEQDIQWPSRRWNKNHTDYIDLSGHNVQ